RRAFEANELSVERLPTRTLDAHRRDLAEPLNRQVGFADDFQKASAIVVNDRFCDVPVADFGTMHGVHVPRIARVRTRGTELRMTARNDDDAQPCQAAIAAKFHTGAFYRSGELSSVGVRNETGDANLNRVSHTTRETTIFRTAKLPCAPGFVSAVT